MLSLFENRIVSIIKSQKKTPLNRCVHGILHLCSLPYTAAVSLRNKAFDHGLFTQHQVNPIVISIGNIVAGGTGKTPVTLLLAEQLLKSYRVAVLSRGYRSQAEKNALPIKVMPNSASALCGDEPLMLARRLPNLSLFVGRNRVKAAQMAAEQGCQILLLDDGMQHRRLQRSFELVVMDAADPFGQGFLLPRGFLREKPSALIRADLIIVNNVTTAYEFSRLRQQIAQYSKAPLVATQMRIKQARLFPEDRPISLESKRVALFCGLAQPNHFRKLVKQQGATIVSEAMTADHTILSEEALHAFAQKSRDAGAEYLVCTEKDRVKLTKETLLPIVWVEAELFITAGEEHWQHFLERINART